MTVNTKATKFAPDTLFFGQKPLLNDGAILDKANELLEELKPQFPRCEANTKVTDTKNARKTVKEMMSFGIGEQQYPAFVKTESYKQLVALVGALNLLAPKWKLQIKPYQDERDLTLGFYDYLDDRYHPSRLAGEILKSYFYCLGQFNASAAVRLSTTENHIIEIMRMRPRVKEDLFSKDFDYKTGTAEARGWLNSIIDPLLLRYPETQHDTQAESLTLAFHRHISKNMVLNDFINSGHYHQSESEQLTGVINAFNQWTEAEDLSAVPAADEADLHIALTFAVIHAVDRPSGFDWQSQIQNNLQDKYISRLLKFVRYVRYAKKEQNKKISLRLIRRGSTNRDLMLYPALLELSDEIHDPNYQVMCRNATKLLTNMKINAELTKFMGNIFGALCCYEGDETDLNIQMFSYCENRKELWDYRTNFMRKLLRLDYDQMESFLDKLDAILAPERDILQSRLNQKIDLYQRGYV
ncbi:hypothetical protein [Pantoea allii]|uniref:hypothetical protein n=1 Tax=Pantoea allii TaxID=574096 RepID=UPI000A231D33|nr:hypothetical protein [Pantoea allii]MBW1254196.1 hypothetical protein [Pantoea allii]MBW1263416.1 hypothetical protein [Pantoea allii]MBW1285292.1 hypothetical protein [Pantoea allii]ORM84034.1 hypothetical protein HA38_15940 [Pantoea allii]PBJ98076.1 hypothetical protein CMR03_22490 [Pantoea allii]